MNHIKLIVALDVPGLKGTSVMVFGVERTDSLILSILYHATMHFVSSNSHLVKLICSKTLTGFGVWNRSKLCYGRPSTPRVLR